MKWLLVFAAQNLFVDGNFEAFWFGKCLHSVLDGKLIVMDGGRC